MTPEALQALREAHPNLQFSIRPYDERPAFNELDRWCKMKFARGQELCKATGIDETLMSCMRKGKRNVSLANAIRLEMATAGELRAEVLRPKDADLIAYLRGTNHPA